MLCDGAAILPCSGGAARIADGLTLNVIRSLIGNDIAVHLLVHVPAASLWPKLGIIPRRQEGMKSSQDCNHR